MVEKNREMPAPAPEENIRILEPTTLARLGIGTSYDNYNPHYCFRIIKLISLSSFFFLYYNIKERNLST